MIAYKNSKFQVSLDDEHPAMQWRLFQYLTREDRCVCKLSEEIWTQYGRIPCNQSEYTKYRMLTDLFS